MITDDVSVVQPCDPLSPSTNRVSRLFSAAARFALERLPNDLAHTPLPQILFPLVASVWDRKYTNIYARAADLLGRFDNHAFSIDVEFQLVLRSMLIKFLGAFVSL